jgi:hypothetical protein
MLFGIDIASGVDPRRFPPALVLCVLDDSRFGTAVLH